MEVLVGIHSICLKIRFAEDETTKAYFAPGRCKMANSNSPSPDTVRDMSTQATMYDCLDQCRRLGDSLTACEYFIFSADCKAHTSAITKTDYEVRDLLTFADTFAVDALCYIKGSFRIKELIILHVS